MSDKHTDAQGELRKVFTTILVDNAALGYDTRPERLAETLSVLAEANFSRRATEGQAQTSAAPVISSYDIEKVKKLKREFVDSMLHSGVQYRTCGQISSMLNQIIADSDGAAQLADSTAPGAPSYEELKADLKTANATIRVLTQGRLAQIRKAAAPTAQQSLTAGGVDWLGLALDLEDKAKRVESQHVERAMVAGAHGLRLMGDGQSLTAGGAVPKCKTCDGTGSVDDGEIDCFPNGMPYENGPVKCFKDCPQCKGAAAPLPQVQSEAARDVLAERRRQIEAEGWTPEHDDEHDGGEMTAAAICYISGRRLIGRLTAPTDMWPWDIEWWKPRDRRRNLVRAAALLVAEIERLDRAVDQQPVTPSGALADNDGGVTK